MSAAPHLPDVRAARDFFRAKLDFTTGPVELQRELEAGNVSLVDVRAAEDYRTSHIPGAVSLPQGNWDHPTGLTKDRLNVIYCYSQVCHLAAKAAVRLAEAGYPVQELEGGFAAWQQHDLPVEPVSKADDAAASNPPRTSGERSPSQENL